MVTRSITIRARCNEAEKKALELVAHDEALKPSEMLRVLIREAAKARGYWPPPDDDGNHPDP